MTTEDEYSWDEYLKPLALYWKVSDSGPSSTFKKTWLVQCRFCQVAYRIHHTDPTNSDLKTLLRHSYNHHISNCE